MRKDKRAHKFFRLGVSLIHVDCADKRLYRICQNRLLRPSVFFSFSTREENVVLKLKRFRHLGKHDVVYERGADTRHFSLLLFRKMIKKKGGDHKLQNRVSQILKAFIVVGFPLRIFIQIRTVSKRFFEERLILKGYFQLFFEFAVFLLRHFALLSHYISSPRPRSRISRNFVRRSFSRVLWLR